MTQVFKIPPLTESENEEEEFRTGKKKKQDLKGEKVCSEKGAGCLSLDCGEGGKSHEEGEKKTRRAEWGLKEEAGLIGATGGIKERRLRNAAG